MKFLLTNAPNSGYRNQTYRDGGASIIEYTIALALIGLVIMGGVLAFNQIASNRATASKSAIDGSRGMVACDPNSSILNMEAGSQECY